MRRANGGESKDSNSFIGSNKDCGGMARRPAPEQSE
jgi:hypothetical protein